MRTFHSKPAAQRRRIQRCLPVVMRVAMIGVVLGLIAAATGCGMIAIERKSTSQKPVLPPLVPPKDAISLDVFFIDRPAGDPLLGSTLWSELDEIGAVPAETRSRLRAAGLRVGLAGSNPPQTLRAAYAEQRSASVQSTRPQQIPLLAGGSTTLESAFISDPFVLQTVGMNSETAREYPGARCVLRVSGERVQDGWVRLSFQPEVHFGPSRIQPQAGDGEWKLQQGPDVDRLLEQRFDVELHVGDLVVIGAADDLPKESIGSRFFRTGVAPGAREHVIVVRVDDLQQIKAERAK